MSDPASEPNLRAKAQRVQDLLEAYYGRPTLKEQRDPLSELVLTILSQNTSDTNSGHAYQILRERFPTWEAVLSAPVDQVAEAIRPGGLANIKAPRIQAILADLQRERGTLDLDFLAPMPVDQARDYLLSLNGIGPKTAACVLLFSLHKPALPVDTHVHRVSLRLGLVPQGTSPDKAHTLLEDLLPQVAYYPFHLLLIQHGRTLCSARQPQCQACPLAELCDYAVAATSSGHEGLSEEGTDSTD